MRSWGALLYVCFCEHVCGIYTYEHTILYCLDAFALTPYHHIALCSSVLHGLHTDMALCLLTFTYHHTVLKPQRTSPHTTQQRDKISFGCGVCVFVWFSYNIDAYDANMRVLWHRGLGSRPTTKCATHIKLMCFSCSRCRGNRLHAMHSFYI